MSKQSWGVGHFGHLASARTPVCACESNCVPFVFVRFGLSQDSSTRPTHSECAPRTRRAPHTARCTFDMGLNLGQGRPCSTCTRMRPLADSIARAARHY
eukprot:1306146-Prymnesium_polylepis.1